MALRRFNAGGKKQKELTEEQKQEIKEAFDLFDTDGSGNANTFVSLRYSLSTRSIDACVRSGLAAWGTRIIGQTVHRAIRSARQFTISVLRAH